MSRPCSLRGRLKLSPKACLGSSSSPIVAAAPRIEGLHTSSVRTELLWFGALTPQMPELHTRTRGGAYLARHLATGERPSAPAGEIGLSADARQAGMERRAAGPVRILSLAPLFELCR